MVSLKRKKRDGGESQMNDISSQSILDSPSGSPTATQNASVSVNSPCNLPTASPNSFNEPDSDIPLTSTPLLHESRSVSTSPTRAFMDRISTPLPQPLGTTRFYPQPTVETHSTGKMALVNDDFDIHASFFIRTSKFCLEAQKR